MAKAKTKTSASKASGGATDQPQQFKGTPAMVRAVVMAAHAAGYQRRGYGRCAEIHGNILLAVKAYRDSECPNGFTISQRTVTEVVKTQLTKYRERLDTNEGSSDAELERVLGQLAQPAEATESETLKAIRAESMAIGAKETAQSNYASRARKRKKAEVKDDTGDVEATSEATLKAMLELTRNEQAMMVAQQETEKQDRQERVEGERARLALEAKHADDARADFREAQAEQTRVFQAAQAEQTKVFQAAFAAMAQVIVAAIKDKP